MADHLRLEVDNTASAPQPLRRKEGGDPPGGDMLEARVKHLEDDMKEVKSDLKNIRERLARLEGEVSKLPGYGGIALIVGVIVALSTLVQVAAKFMPTAP